MHHKGIRNILILLQLLIIAVFTVCYSGIPFPELSMIATTTSTTEESTTTSEETTTSTTSSTSTTIEDICPTGELSVNITGNGTCNNQPTLSWNPIDDVLYSLSFYDNASMTDPVYTADELSDTSFSSAILPSGNVYYRIEASHENCDKISSNGSISILGGWIPLGDKLNYDTNQDAKSPCLDQDSAGNLYAAWNERFSSLSRIVVAKYESGSWTYLGSPLHNGFGLNAYRVDLKIIQDVPYVIFYESGTLGDGFFMYKYDGSNWVQVGNNLVSSSNVDIGYPKLAYDGTSIYATWHEYDNSCYCYHVTVKKWEDPNWNLVGTVPINLDTTRSATNPVITSFNNEIYVAWAENISKHNTIVVKKWDGANWDLVGSPILNNSKYQAGSQNLLVYNNELYVFWDETNNTTEYLYCSKFDGSKWVLVGDRVNVFDDRFISDVKVAAGTNLYCSFKEETKKGNKVTLRVFENGKWTQKGYYLNNTSDNDASNPAVVVQSGDIPVVIWQEYENYISQIYVRRYQCP